jgi:hypothetical protein
VRKPLSKPTRFCFHRHMADPTEKRRSRPWLIVALTIAILSVAGINVWLAMTP